MSERHDAFVQLKEDVRDLEGKHQEALALVSQRDSSLTQLQEELKQMEKRVRRDESLDVLSYVVCFDLFCQFQQKY